MSLKIGYAKTIARRLGQKLRIDYDATTDSKQAMVNCKTSAEKYESLVNKFERTVQNMTVIEI